RALHTDPQARIDHDELLRTADALAQVLPPTAPADLHERLSAAVAATRAAPPRRWLPWRRSRAASDQHFSIGTNLSGAPPYIRQRQQQSATGEGIRALPSTSNLRHSKGRDHMKNRTIIAVGGGLAVAIAAVLYF